MADSILAGVGPGNRHRDHLAIALAKLARAVHRRLVESQVSYENLRRQAVNSQNVSYGSRLRSLFFINAS